MKPRRSNRWGQALEVTEAERTNKDISELGTYRKDGDVTRRTRM